MDQRREGDRLPEAAWIALCAAVAAGNRCTGASKWTSVPAARHGRPGARGGRGAPGAAGTQGTPVPESAPGTTVGQGTGSAPSAPRIANVPGLQRATFKGGYTLSIMKADVDTGEAREVWHNQSNDRIANNLTNPRLAGDYVVFPLMVGGGRGGRGARGAAAAEPDAAPQGPVDEWDRYYSLNIASPDSRPMLLTTTDGLIEDQTSVAISSDGKTFYYCTNAGDIERRHIWAVPVTGGTPHQVTTGAGIETSPTPLSSGKTLATLSADWKMPQSLGLWQLSSSSAGLQKIAFPTSRSGFPADAHVEPALVLTKASDGLEIHNQLFVPKDIRAGERRPAIVFVHGGPVRQMLLGYHYMQFYHWAYGINQWLASQGYVVLSVNYRSGIGYADRPNLSQYRGKRQCGISRRAGRGQVPADAIGCRSQSHRHLGIVVRRRADLTGAGPQFGYLQGRRRSGRRPSLGQLARPRRGVFQVIHDRRDRWMEVPGPARPWRRRSERGISTDDRPRKLLRQRDVYFELIVFPDDTHESMLYSRWMYTLRAHGHVLQEVPRGR